MARITPRTYLRRNVAGFCKTKETNGILSNMASGQKAAVNGLLYDSSEAIYQACRFPRRPDLQVALSNIASPMGAKRFAHQHLSSTRSDWHDVNIEIMRWCLRVKLAQNLTAFGRALEATSELPIVEISMRDDWWGAVPGAEGTLRGCNVLGRLLMELRQDWRGQVFVPERPIEPPAIPDFLINGELVGLVQAVTPSAPVLSGQMDLGF